MGFGRFVCVGLPLVLVIAAIISLLIPTLAGVTSDDLYIFDINLKNMSISTDQLSDLVGDLDLSDLGLKERDTVDVAAERDVESRDLTISASDLGLDDVYQINLWSVCQIDSDGDKNCTDAQFDWAANVINASFFDNFGGLAGEAASLLGDVSIDLPSDIQDALKAFRTIMKWTEIAFIAALVALALELVVGVFSNCSRAVSCCTWLIAIVAALLVCAAAGLATATGLIVIGAVEAAGKQYGVKADINTGFLAAVWISAACSIAAALFWIFTICCCAPDHHRKSKGSKFRDSVDGEKLIPGAATTPYSSGYVTGGYSPITHDHEMTGGANASYYNNNATANRTPPQFNPSQFDHQYEQPYEQAHHEPSSYAQQYSGVTRYPSSSGRTDLAYEPYSHRA